MREWLERIKRHPVVAHALCANARFTERLGPQLAGAITYFSVLSIVPMLMFVFAIVGMTLTVLRPDMLADLTAQIHQALGQGGLGEAAGGEESIAEKLTGVITGALLNWRGVLGVAILTTGYAGSRWAGNLKSAVRAMWSTDFSDATAKKNFFVELGLNLLTFLGLVTTLFLGLGIASVGGSLSHQLVSWLGWQDVPGMGLLIQLVAVLLTFVAGWVMFAFLFIVLPNEPVSPRPWLIGTLVGALGVTVLQSVAGRLIGLLSGNASAAIFGNAIVVMLLFNTLATFILFTAAWVGTEQVWREVAAEEVDAVDEPEPQPAPEPVAAAEPPPWGELPRPGEDTQVRADVAAHGMRINLGLGYGLGAATGLGLGAVVVSVARSVGAWLRSRSARR
ncbi:MAG: YihY/virulence factor BrkB family protein [Arachnia sp.]